MDAERALRERLVDVGVELVLTEGTASLGLREIARRAGVSHGAPRRYFPTHRSLLSAIARRGFEELSARSATATAEVVTPRDQLSAMAHAYVLSGDPSHAIWALRRAVWLTTGAQRDAYRKQIDDMRSGMRRGRFDVRAAADTVVAGQ